MKKVKKILAVMLTFISIMALNIMANAEENWQDLLGTVVDGSTLTEAEESTGEALKILRGNYISDGSSYISNEGNGVVYISGSTNCRKTSDEVRVDLYLQRLVDGDWQNVTCQYHVEYNTNYAHNGFYIAVARGYYYRTLTNHTVICGDTVEYLTSRTDWLYVD